MKRIVFPRADGGVSIVAPAPEFLAKYPTEAEGLAALQERQLAVFALEGVVIDETNICLCEEAEVPADRTFRDAWERDTTASPDPLRTDMPKARTIHMDRIRAARDRRLEEKDREFMRAVESKDNARQNAIAAEKQALRDIPQTFDLTVAKDAAELAALWPAELPPH